MKSEPMRIVSVNISSVRTVQWKGREVVTGIFKQSVQGRLMLRKLNLDGDRQADLKVHGGKYKAVYVYPFEHYAWWRGELGRDLPLGMFGENLTIEGMREENVCVGDKLRVGEAVLQAVQPRLPCFKLQIRFGDDRMVERFLASGRWGVYFSVRKEGLVGAGDAVSWGEKDAARFPVSELARLHYAAKKDRALLRRALKLKALPQEWRERFRGALHANVPTQA